MEEILVVQVKGKRNVHGRACMAKEIKGKGKLACSRTFWI